MAAKLQAFLSERVCANDLAEGVFGEVRALQALHASGPSTTARLITRATEEAARKGDERATEACLWQLWRLICDTARSVPEVQDGLVCLVDAVSKLPDIAKSGSPGDHGTTTFTVWGMKLWSELPIFDAHWAEFEFNVPPFTAAEVNSEGYQKYLNIQRFAANLSARGESSYSLLGFGAREIMMVLEEEFWKAAGEEQQKDGSDSDDGDLASREWMRRQKELSSIRSLAAGVPVVAEWIMVTGSVLYTARVEIPRRIVPGNLWQGENITCPERWKLWKARLAWIGTVQELTQQTKDLVESCLQAMDQVQAESR